MTKILYKIILYDSKCVGVININITESLATSKYVSIILYEQK